MQSSQNRLWHFEQFSRQVEQKVLPQRQQELTQPEQNPLSQPWQVIEQLPQSVSPHRSQQYRLSSSMESPHSLQGKSFQSVNST